MLLTAPSGKELICELNDSGGGNFTANIVIDEDGKLAISSHFQIDNEQYNVQLWYPHTE